MADEIRGGWGRPSPHTRWHYFDMDGSDCVGLVVLCQEACAVSTPGFLGLRRSNWATMVVLIIPHLGWVLQQTA